MVNWEFYDNQTPSSVNDLVDAIRLEILLLQLADPTRFERGSKIQRF